MKGSVNFFLLIIGLVLIFAFVRDDLVKTALVAYVRQSSGINLSIKKMSLGLMSGSVRIDGLKVYHPAGFPYGVMADIPQLAIDLDLQSVFRDPIHLKYFKLNVSEIRLVRTPEGALNVDTLKTQFSAQEPSRSNDAGSKGQPMVDGRKIVVDLVSLDLGKVVVEELRFEGEAKVRVFDLDLHNKEFKNISSLEQLIALVLSQSQVVVPFNNGSIKVRGLSGDVMTELLKGLK